MLQKTREDTTGINLEVNERILDSCTELMKVSLNISCCVIINAVYFVYFYTSCHSQWFNRIRFEKLTHVDAYFTHCLCYIVCKV